MYRLAWVVLCACRFHFAPNEADGALPPADACTWSPFGQPRNVAEVNSSGDDWGAWLSNDKLDLYFGSARGGPFAIYHASRPTTADLFGAPMPVGGLIASGSADDPFMTDDGLQLFFENSPTTLGKDAQLVVSVRANTAQAFAQGQVLGNINDALTQDAAATVTSDALTIVWTSTRAGGLGMGDLYMATRPTASSAFANVQHLSIDTPGNDCCASIAGDGSSMILINDSTGTSRIMYAARGGADFTTPVMFAPELSGATGSETDPTLTRDGTTIVFSSDRAGGAGGFDIYLAERRCL